MAQWHVIGNYDHTIRDIKSFFVQAKCFLPRAQSNQRKIPENFRFSERKILFFIEATLTVLKLNSSKLSHKYVSIFPSIKKIMSLKQTVFDILMQFGSEKSLLFLPLLLSL